MSASTESMPFLSIRRRAALETRRRTQRFSLSTQKRRYCRLGRKRRLVLLLAWETLFPTMGFLPVTSQTRAMRNALQSIRSSLAPRLAARLARTSPRHERGGGDPVGLAHFWSTVVPPVFAKNLAL